MPFKPNRVHLRYQGIYSFEEKDMGSLLGLLVLVADVYAIVITAQSKASTNKKVLWIVLVLLLPVLGCILWYFAGPKK